MPTSVVVLAAGSSRRLGRPKQTLPFRGGTLLGATLDAVRTAEVDQRIVTLGGAAEAVRVEVGLEGFDVVEVEHHGEGCAASVAAAVASVHLDADGVVLVLGDQPGIAPADLVAVGRFARSQPIRPDAVVCRYDDGRGHPLWFSRTCFDALGGLHGDKAVWRLLESGDLAVAEMACPGRTIPLDVDTWDDHRALCAADEAVGAR